MMFTASLIADRVRRRHYARTKLRAPVGSLQLAGTSRVRFKQRSGSADKWGDKYSPSTTLLRTGLQAGGPLFWVCTIAHRGRVGEWSLHKKLGLFHRKVKGCHERAWWILYLLQDRCSNVSAHSCGAPSDVGRSVSEVSCIAWEWPQQADRGHRRTSAFDPHLRLFTKQTVRATASQD